MPMIDTIGLLYLLAKHNLVVKFLKHADFGTLIRHDGSKFGVPAGGLGKLIPPMSSQSRDDLIKQSYLRVVAIETGGATIYGLTTDGRKLALSEAA